MSQLLPCVFSRQNPRTALIAATVVSAAAVLSYPGSAAAADTVAPPQSVAYKSTVKTVNGHQMTIWTKPANSGGAARIATANGHVWFAEQKTGKIVKFGLDGVADIFKIPGKKTRVRSVTSGPNNDIWFTGYNKGVVGRTTAAGQIQLFSAKVSKPKSQDMTLGLDGNLWFATNAGKLGSTTPGGETKLFKIKNKKKKPSALTVGGDGNIWFVQQAGKNGKKKKSGKKNLARMTPSGKMTEFQAKSRLRDSYGITTGPDGRIWFCDPERKRIGRVALNGRDLTYFKKGLKGTPISIVTGPDNQMYFGEKEGRIGRISVSGKISEFPIPGAAGTKKFPIQGLTVGPQGNVWFVNNRRSQVGKLRLLTGNVDCVKGVWNNLEACGWPGPDNTGYPAGKSLRNTSGRIINADNTVIEGEKITGGLVIDAKNVVVKNSWVIQSAGGVNASGVIKIEPGASVTIVRTTLDGSNATHAGIWYEGARLVARENNIYGVNDGIFSWDGDNYVIEDNYLHDFTEDAANGHVDGFQTEGASHGIIRHNVFDVQQDQTSAVAIWNGRRDSDDILIENNLMAGGGFTVYAHDYHPSSDNPTGGNSVTNVRILNNKFSTVHYPCVGVFGVWFVRGAPTDRWNRLGNVVLETQQNIDSSNPIVDGWECR